MQTANFDPENLIDLDAFCELARMGRDGYRALRRQGRTPEAIKMGRRIYFDRDDAIRWVKEVRMIRLQPSPGLQDARSDSRQSELGISSSAAPPGKSPPETEKAAG